MKSCIRSALAGAALLGASLAAHADHTINIHDQKNLSFNQSNVADFHDNVVGSVGQTFLTKFFFNLVSASGASSSLWSEANYVANKDLNITRFDLFKVSGTTANVVATGTENFDVDNLESWFLKTTSPLTTGSYYLGVYGTLALENGGSFEGKIALSNATVAPIPEPEVWGMMFGGLGLIGFLARRRSKTAAKPSNQLAAA